MLEFWRVLGELLAFRLPWKLEKFGSNYRTKKQCSSYRIEELERSNSVDKQAKRVVSIVWSSYNFEIYGL